MESLTIFLERVTAPGMIVYTILLGVVVVYWLVVIVGLLDVEFLDAGLNIEPPEIDGLGEAAGEALDGALDGSAEAVGDAAAEVGGEAGAGALASFLGFINLGKVPVTLIASFLVLKMWVLAYVYNVYLASSIAALIPGFGFLFAVFAFFLILCAGLFLTGLSTTPFVRIYEHKTTRGRTHLIGRPCLIKTSRVSPDFGQGEVRVDDSVLLLSIRCEEEGLFAKGDEATIIGYDRETDTYEVGIL